MADDQLITAELAVRFVPDVLTPQEEASGSSRPLGAGFYEIGAVFDGAFIPFAMRKAGGVQKKLDAAKAAASKSDTTTTAAGNSGEGTGTGSGSGQPEQTV